MGARAPAPQRMTPLFANDPPGSTAPTWYREDFGEVPLPSPPLKGQLKADLCIIGGGFTGLSAAFHATKAGLSVVLLEARYIGFGASARNGGQIGSGYNWSMRDLEARLGRERAKGLWDIAEAGKAQAKTLAGDAFRPGIINACLTRKEAEEAQAEIDQMNNDYSTDYTWLEVDKLQDRIGSSAYTGGAFTSDTGFCNPLVILHGLAKAARDAGAQIFEGALVHDVAAGRVRTDAGQVRAPHVFVATNGYGANLTRASAARVLPINNYIAVTEPLGALAPMPKPLAVADSRFVVNYFWQSDDGRLVYGGGESYGTRYPDGIAERVRSALSKVYPELNSVRFTHAWGGTLAVTGTRLPFVGEPKPGLFVAGGFSGHGVALTQSTGAAIVDAILGNRHAFDLLQALPTPPLPGGALFGPLITNAGMAFAAFRDRMSGK